MKILVTGGAGFVGSVLVPQLLKKNYKVCVVDNLMYDNGHAIIPFFKNHKFKFIKGDARDQSLMNDLVPNFEFVIHLAAIVGFPACRKNPELATAVNVDSCKLISSLLSKDQGTVYASTGSNYGIIENEICTEKTPLNPISLYGKTKTEAEEIFLNENGAVAYRFATAFGLSPRMRLDLLINDFVYQAINNKTLVMFEKAFKRTFIHVDDMARSIIYAIENYDKMRNDTFNVGGDFNNYNKEEIALMIKHKVDYYLHFAEFGEDEDKRNYEVSYEKINNAGFRIKKTVEEGINELIQAVPALDSRSKYKNV
jgi:nucleoside-diphosphate-sugar epimerase